MQAVDCTLAPQPSLHFVSFRTMEPTSQWLHRAAATMEPTSNDKNRFYFFLFNFFSVAKIAKVVLTIVSGISEMLSMPHSTKNFAKSG